MTKQLEKVKTFLNSKRIPYEVVRHPEAFTAQEIAGAAHIPGKMLVKSVIVRGGDHYLMCVLPAVHLVDFQKLEKASGMRSLELASEEEIAKLFPDCEVGAEPPFGDWEGQHLEVIADKALTEDREIVFSAGSHGESLKIKFSDYQKLVKAKFADIGVHI